MASINHFINQFLDSDFILIIIKMAFTSFLAYSTMIPGGLYLLLALSLVIYQDLHA